MTIFLDDNRLGGDDSVPASGEGRVYFQKVPGSIANAGGVNKRPSKAFGNIIINSISNSSCTTVYDVPAETTNSQPLFEKRLQQQSSSRSTLQGGTKLVDIKPNTVKWEVNNFSPGRAFSTVRCIKDRLGGGGGGCQKTSTGGVWSQAEQTLHINILELRAAKFAILTFCRYVKDLAVHVRMDN